MVIKGFLDSKTDGVVMRDIGDDVSAFANPAVKLKMCNIN